MNCYRAIFDNFSIGQNFLDSCVFDIMKVKDNEVNFEVPCEGHPNYSKTYSTIQPYIRSFNYLDIKTFICLYKTMVRTHLDYASSVWSPYKIKHIEMIENVQRRCTRQMPYPKDLSYPERLKKLNLPILAYRRLRGDMFETYKIIKGIYDKESASFLKMWTDIAQRI